MHRIFRKTFDTFLLPPKNASTARKRKFTKKIYMHQKIKNNELKRREENGKVEGVRRVLARSVGFSDCCRQIGPSRAVSHGYATYCDAVAAHRARIGNQDARLSYARTARIYREAERAPANQPRVTSRGCFSIIIKTRMVSRAPGRLDSRDFIRLAGQRAYACGCVIISRDSDRKDVFSMRYRARYALTVAARGVAAHL